MVLYSLCSFESISGPLPEDHSSYFFLDFENATAEQTNKVAKQIPDTQAALMLPSLPPPTHFPRRRRLLNGMPPSGPVKPWEWHAKHLPSSITLGAGSARKSTLRPDFPAGPS